MHHMGRVAKRILIKGNFASKILLEKTLLTLDHLISSVISVERPSSSIQTRVCFPGTGVIKTFSVGGPLKIRFESRNQKILRVSLETEASRSIF